MTITQVSSSRYLTLDETVNRLTRSAHVMGLALFGARTTAARDSVSDYDLLVFLAHQPIPIFQMLTHIDGRMADIVFADVETAERIFTLDHPVKIGSPEGMLIHKIYNAEIVYDASGWLANVQRHVQTRSQVGDWLLTATERERYAAWFWQNHGLFHVKRMAQSRDPIYVTAADLMLMRGLADLCRSYYTVRQLVWEGEKAALRYLAVHDPEYLALLQSCLAEHNRGRKIEQFEQLVAHALAPAAPPWSPGVTAVILRNSTQQPEQVEEALQFWEGLLNGADSVDHLS